MIRWRCTSPTSIRSAPILPAFQASRSPAASVPLACRSACSFRLDRLKRTNCCVPLACSSGPRIGTSRDPRTVAADERGGRRGIPSGTMPAEISSMSAHPHDSLRAFAEDFGLHFTGQLQTVEQLKLSDRLSGLKVVRLKEQSLLPAE